MKPVADAAGFRVFIASKGGKSMAIEAIDKATSLKVKLNKGEGKHVVRSFGNLNAEVSNADLMKAGLAIGDLVNYPLSSVYRTDTVTLVEA